jgi:hypothetical protein
MATWGSMLLPDTKKLLIKMSSCRGRYVLLLSSRGPVMVTLSFFESMGSVICQR